jgi:hypothetical protein
MSELPAPLAPWVRELSVFKRELRLGLGDLALHLARELGPLRLLLTPVSGEPDGYDGLSRRGNFERLLPHEWALALEIPEEFIRRAAENELRFFQLALRAPSGSRRSIALFDAGPDQLGAPRIGQLAALVALSNRASAAGASFSWGVLQRTGLRSEWSPASLRHFLAGRSSHEVSPEMLAQWETQLGKAERADDLWLIGDESLAKLPGAQRASILAIRESQGADRKLSIEVHRPAASQDREPWSSAITLALPSEKICEKLIRAPWFEVRTDEKPRKDQAPRDDGFEELREPLDPSLAPLFDPSGTRVYARTKLGKLVIVVLNESRDTYPLPRVMPLREGRVTGLGFGSGELRVAVQERSGAWLLTTRPGRFRLTARSPDSLWGVPQAPDPARFSVAFGTMLWHASGALIEQVPRGVRASEVASFAFQGGELSWVARQTEYADGGRDGPGLIRWPKNGPHKRQPIETDVPVLEAFHGHYAGGGQYLQHSLVAVRAHENSWTMFWQNSPQKLRVPDDTQVVGAVMGRAGKVLEPRLLLLDKEGQLYAKGADGTQEIPISSLRGKIRLACASAYGTQVAAITDRGELLVYSLGRKRVLVHIDPDELS